MNAGSVYDGDSNACAKPFGADIAKASSDDAFRIGKQRARKRSFRGELLPQVPSAKVDALIQNETLSKHLGQRQLNAMACLVFAPSIAKAAKMAGVGRATIYRWLHHDSAFREALGQCRREATLQAIDEMRGLSLAACRALADLIEAGDPRVKLRAAQAVFSLALQIHEDDRIRTRLDLLEDALLLKAKPR